MGHGHSTTLLFNLFKKNFSRDFVKTHLRVVEITETRKKCNRLMYQFERLFCKRPCTRTLLIINCRMKLVY